jgi:hypothetical protein
VGAETSITDPPPPDMSPYAPGHALILTEIPRSAEQNPSPDDRLISARRRISVKNPLGAN